MASLTSLCLASMATMRHSAALVAKTAPIYALPYELTKEILSLTLTPRECTWGPPRGPGILLPPNARDVLTLCRVCALWRHIMIESPRLWAIPKMPITDRMGRLSVEATHMFLDRSGQHSVNVDVCPIWHKQAVELPRRVAKASNRWRKFQLQYFNSPLSKAEVAALAPLIRGHWERLVEVDFWISDAANWDSSILDFTDAPLLHTVSLTVPTNFILPPIQWAQLTHLNLAHPCPLTCLDILQSCENIVSAQISTLQWSDSDDLPPQFAVTAKLEHLADLELTMRVSTSEAHPHLQPFLRSIRAQSLTKLSLSLSIHLDHRELLPISPALESFLLHSRRLEHLSLDNCASPHDLPDLLLRTPLLTSLKLKLQGTPGREFMLALTGNLIPKLQSLELELLDVGSPAVTVDFPYVEFAEMVESRLGTLKDVVVEDQLGPRTLFHPSWFLEFKHRVFREGLRLCFLL
ncbi:hypothetical protein HMN09_00897200 [Mycena chlorophos]|uniref:F-box domain-containing protein n=1 Tax=Mycena chlorophos TaxID=658473 RepID=A0A8H6W2J6_MYCCL|nr:hypothetical protein HMN09_00897200 [Mycena chlorophos]